MAKNDAPKGKVAVKQQEEAVSSTNKEIGQAQGKMEKITKSNKDGELEIQKLEHKMNKASDEAKEVKICNLIFFSFGYLWLKKQDRRYSDPLAMVKS